MRSSLSKALLLCLLLASCGGDDQAQDMSFDGVSYLKILTSNMKIVDNKLT